MRANTEGKIGFLKGKINRIEVPRQNTKKRQEKQFNLIKNFSFECAHLLTLSAIVQRFQNRIWLVLQTSLISANWYFARTLFRFSRFLAHGFDLLIIGAYFL